MYKKNFTPLQKNLFLGSSVLGFVLIDQVIKYWVSENRPDFSIFSWLQIVYAENYGIAFSLPVTGIVTIVLTFVVLAVMVRWWKQTGWNTPFVLLFAGAIGNLIDRVFRGFVVDYVAVGGFPIFNLADACITIGVALLLWYEVKNSP